MDPFMRTPMTRLLSTALVTATLGTTTIAHADVTLPAPYISRALDAVLLPIDASVRDAFALAADEDGVLVLAVETGGVADTADIAPGDVISMIHGEAVSDPVVLDEIVYYWITAGTFDFVFDGYRAGTVYSASSTITEEMYVEVIDVTTVESWSSYSYEGFSYADYSASYSEEMTATYESSETMIEEAVTSEEFTADMTDESADTMADDGTDAAVDDGTDDAAAADDGTDASADDGSADDGGDAGGDDGGSDDAAVDE
jgi:hypothetical protein